MTVRSVVLPVFAAAWVLFSCTDPAWAHRVNVFAWADGDAVQVECSFSKSQKVKNGKLAFFDAATGEALGEAVTDDKGMYRYVLPPSADAGHGLRIVLNAGEGHRNEWTLSAAELGSLGGAPSKQPSAGNAGSAGALPAAEPLPERKASAGDAAAPARSAASPEGGKVSALSEEDYARLEKLIAGTVDAKLAPVRRALAESVSREPSLKDIVGGLGWFLGLFGIAVLLKGRKR